MPPPPPQPPTSQSKAASRLKLHRAISATLIVLIVPLLMILAVLEVRYQWAMFIAILWEIPALTYGVIIFSAKCPRCGGPFFYRDVPAGSKLRWGRNCQNCRFPEKQ